MNHHHPNHHEFGQQQQNAPRFQLGAPVGQFHPTSSSNHHQQEIFQSLPTVFSGQHQQQQQSGNPMREEDIYESIYDSRWHMMNKVSKGRQAVLRIIRVQKSAFISAKNRNSLSPSFSYCNSNLGETNFLNPGHRDERNCEKEIFTKLYIILGL